jgi:hypothetical protein
MKQVFLLGWLLILQPVVLAVEINLGGTRLVIPAPEGYSLITSDMQPFADYAKRFVPPQNEQFAQFLTTADTAEAARGKIPQYKRWFAVQAAKATIQPFITASDFGKLKRAITFQNGEILKKAEKEMPGIAEKINKGIKDDYKADLNFSFNQMLPFPPHHESDRAVAFSMLMKMNATDQDGKQGVVEMTVTVTLIHLKGKVLFLYANAEKSGLAWCRAESRKWMEAIISANPSTGEVAARESGPSRSGFDWSGVAIGGLIGGVIGALSYALRKKKS